MNLSRVMAKNTNQWSLTPLIESDPIDFIEFGLGTKDNPQPAYKNSDADVVPNIAGFNGNPIKWIKSIIAIPDLSKGPSDSPHTLPLGYTVEPTRYSGPYKEEGAP